MNTRATVSLSLLFAACNGSPTPAPTPGAIGFDGAIDGWQAASTGGSGPDARWERRADAAAVSPPDVLAVTAIQHDSDERFNLFWKPLPAFRDGRIAVRVRADDGVVDQGGGPIWRVQDANNYYVCRFNPLESNYRVYVVHDGVRQQLGTVLVDAKAGSWHAVEVEHVGDHIVCWLDGQRLLDVRDATIPQAGGVGLWTKADARTSFDDLVVTPSGG